MLRFLITPVMLVLYAQLSAQVVLFESDFEDSPVSNWSQTGWATSSTTVLGTPDGRFMHLNPLNEYEAGANSQVTTDALDFTGYYDLRLEFDLSYDVDDDEGFLLSTNEEDGLRIIYSPDGGSNWYYLGSVDEGYNWFNQTDIQAFTGSNNPGWTGNSNGWIRASIPLPSNLENNSQVRFAFQFASGSEGLLDGETLGVGVGIDNFTVTSFSTNPNAGPGGINTNLSLWLKADGNRNSGNSIGVWADASGNANHARQPTSTSQPGWSDNFINHNPVMLFDQDYLEGSGGFYTREFYVVLDPDFISSSSAETGDVIGFQPGDVGSIELGSSTSQFDNELITHTINPATSYRSAYIDSTGERVLANPIIINDRLNSGANGQDIFLNGQQVNNDEEVLGDHQNFDDGAYVIGYGFDFSDDFQGGVAELISYSSPLSSADQAQVLSYLAIKYGITLDEDPSSSTVNFDYTLSGSTIWPGSSNAAYQGYHHDVAGIGKDAFNQTLDQTESQSINDATIVKIDSPDDLDDDEYLVWGNNDSTNEFTNTHLITGVTHRLNRTWKVKHTGNVGAVTVKFDITNLSVDKDYTTLNMIKAPASATIPDDLGDDAVAELVLGGYVVSAEGRDWLVIEDVNFNDGDFFTIGGDVQTIAPGGVAAGLTLWLRPNSGVNFTESDLVTSWSDVSGNGNDADQGDDSEKPAFVRNAINGNNALDFNNDFLDGVAGFNTNDFFIVAIPDDTIKPTNDIGFLLGFKNGAFDGMYLGDQADVANASVGYAFGNYRSAQTSGVINSSVAILNARNNVSESRQELYANDNQIDNYESNPSDFDNRNNTFFRLGNNFLETQAYNGKIAEVISYNDRLSDTEHRDVVTYLALKYGITLDISAEPYTVEGVSIYNNTSYRYDIAGIGLNLDHGLNQPTSMSINGGAMMKISAGATFGDKDYVVWGNDGTNKALVKSSEVPAGFTDERLQTEWQVDVYGSPGAVDVGVYVGDVNDFDVRSKEASVYTLIINDSNDFTSATTTVSGSYFSGDTVFFEGVTFSDNDYFTIGVPETINLNPSPALWLRADFGTDVTVGGGVVSSWVDNGLGNNATSTGTARPTFVENVINGNPALDFDGTNDYIGGVAGFYTQEYFIVLDPDLTYNSSSAGGIVVGFESGDYSAFGLGSVTSALPNEVVTHLLQASTSYRSAQTGSASYSTPTLFNSRENASANGQDIFANGALISNAEANASSYGTLSNRAFRLGQDLNGSTSFFNGKIAELISFSQPLSDTEHRNIETYLAVKYGISLDITSEGYTLDGVSIYNNTSYGQDIAGIGANNEQGLAQASSMSLNSSAIISVSNPSSLSNGDYLIWGHDGGSVGAVTTGLPSTVTERLSRVWSIEETGDVGTVSVSADLSGYGFSGYESGDFSLILDSDSDFSNGVDRIVSATSFSGDVVVFDDVEVSGSVYIGIGTGRDYSTDSDSDGIPDYFELAYGTDPADGNSPIASGGDDNNEHGTVPDNGMNDTGINGDGITDALEYILIANGATSPISRVTDTDGDGIPDYLEVADGTDPYDASQPDVNGDSDTDSDGIPDAMESYIATAGGAADPSLGTDTDGDGIPDYYEVINGSDPANGNSPTLNGATDSDGDGVTDAMEEILLAGGHPGPITADSDLDGDGIPDHVEAWTNTDPFNIASPALPATYNAIRSLQADYQVKGSNCQDMSGYQWIHVADQNGNIVYSINPVGNDLGSTCWAVRVLQGEDKIRSQRIKDVQDEYVMNRNWWIAPTTQPSSNVYIRFYSLDTEPEELRSKVINEGYSTSELNPFKSDSIHITKISGVDDLDPFVSGGSRMALNPVVTDAGSLGIAMTVGINSFSSFVPHYSPGNDDVPLPIELHFFKGAERDGQVVLEWETLSETNNDKFIIERAGYGGGFQPIMEMSGKGNTSQKVFYSLTDQTPNTGLNFYRLKQVDYDGKYSVTDPIVVRVGEQSAMKWTLYPNPATDEIRLKPAKGTGFGSVALRILDMSGRQYPVNSLQTAEEYVIPVGHLPVGHYLLEYEEAGEVKSMRFMVQRH
ncbi:T9SS type A sorting domain-containing protein [Marinoscillum furvescens]|uniref:DUF8202 domain-containing protein n=1 Tax=Marinoscillum furvescens DSM 4134 TaxID=1122208 RepID=A0A3D9KYQ8_MARFU|nr:T9SS type A sorting domain-containing protein [Marinoscillum furvescens]RED94425.1 hypothetical protein C7460_121112 [Marinoscillum furvescens DSM 4134]